MSAVMSISGKRRGRPRHSFEDSAVESDLNYWGRQQRRVYYRDGFSPENVIENIAAGFELSSEHRVLTRDMPAKAWEIHYRIMMLYTTHRLALIARYCVPVKEKGAQAGQPYSAEELAGAIGCPTRVYRHWLEYAKKRYKAMVFPDLTWQKF